MFNNNYNAREIMEALRAAEQQRLEAIEYHKAELKELGTDMNHTTTNVNININKGKIIEITKEVEVPVIKEVVIDNTDTATIEMLRETIRQMNENINDMNKQIEEQNEEIMALEEQNAFLTGQVTGLQNELKEEKANVKTVYIEVETEHFEEEQVEETKVAPQTNTRIIEMNLTIYDLHRTNDGCYRGYTKDYEFVWDTIKNVPAMKVNGGKCWRPMIKEYYQQAQYIKQQILEFKDSVVNKQQDKPVTKTTKESDEQEIVVNVSNDNYVKPGDTVVVKASDIFGSNDTDDEDILGNTDELEFM